MTILFEFLFAQLLRGGGGGGVSKHEIPFSKHNGRCSRQYENTNSNYFVTNSPKCEMFMNCHETVLQYDIYYCPGSCNYAYATVNY